MSTLSQDLGTQNGSLRVPTGRPLDVTRCTVADCHAERVGLAMCARHLWTWAMRHDEKAAA
jgi:hypothetical protein